MVVIIDNYDSFTYSIVQYLYELKAEVMIFRNDEVSISDISDLSPDRLVVSPGPGTPKNAGISSSVIESFFKTIPLLGICLGHQCIGECFGGRVVAARKPMHGKTSLIHHSGLGLFDSITSPFQATRYNSLILEKESIPDSLEITAWTEKECGELDEVMGLRHRNFPLEGIQFHPESIMTQFGHEILNNFLDS